MFAPILTDSKLTTEACQSHNSEWGRFAVGLGLFPICLSRGLTCLLLLFCQSPRNAVAQTKENAPIPVLLDNMDGPQPALRLVNRLAGLVIHHQSIDPSRTRFGRGSEHIRLSCPSGSSAQLAYSVPPAVVIEELRAEAWVLCNRPGLRLAATVVLPRTKNPTTGLPFELLVRGALSNPSGTWQQLTLGNMPQDVACLTRVARAQHGSALDQRGAYMSHLVLLAPGGPGVTEIAVDRLAVFGAISSTLAQPSPSSNTAPSRKHIRGETIRGGEANFFPPNSRSAISASSRQTAPSQALCIIQWQGEPLEMLAKLGFEAVAMQRLPTPEESEQAKKNGLSLICPPPTPKQLSEQGMGDDLSAVQTWEMSEPVTPDELELANRWQQLLKRHDVDEKRPLLISAQIYTREASRIGDVVLLNRPLLGSGLSLQDYSTWLTARQRLARPGTPLWTAVETELSPPATRQLAALCPTAGRHNSASYAQIVAMTSVAIGAKSRGFYFRSHSSLAEKDPNTRRRALSLELANLRLGLAKPWLTQGKVLAGARATLPNLSALVLQVERSQLLVPVHWSDTFEASEQQPTAGPVSFIVPGVAESSEAYLLTFAGPERVRHQRVTGGIRVSVDQLRHDALLLLTDDRQAFSQVARYLRRHLPRAARIHRELAALQLQESIQVTQRLSPTLTSARELQEQLGQARRELQLCDQHLAGQDFELAYQQAQRVEQSLQRSEKMLRDEVRPSWEYGLATLPDQLQLQTALSHSPRAANRLAGGGFEDLAAMLQAGWRHQQLPLEGITSAVRLSPKAPRSGSYCLELEAQPLDKTTPPAVVPTAPVWITSAPIAARAGDLIEITGVARVPTELHGSVDGLQIIDSLGGLEMALRIGATPSWQPFRVLRAATSDTQVSVTLALTGFGTAQVDDLAIRRIRLPMAASQTARGPQQSAR